MRRLLVALPIAVSGCWIIAGTPDFEAAVGGNGGEAGHIVQGGQGGSGAAAGGQGGDGGEGGGECICEEPESCPPDTDESPELAGCPVEGAVVGVCQTVCERPLPRGTLVFSSDFEDWTNGNADGWPEPPFARVNESRANPYTGCSAMRACINGGYFDVVSDQFNLTAGDCVEIRGAFRSVPGAMVISALALGLRDESPEEFLEIVFPDSSTWHTGVARAIVPVGGISRLRFSAGDNDIGEAPSSYEFDAVEVEVLPTADCDDGGGGSGGS